MLDAMVRRHHLSASASAAAARTPVPRSVQRLPEVTDHFTDAVVRGLLADKRLGPTPAVQGGLYIKRSILP